MTDERWIGKEAVLVFSNYYPYFCLEGLEKLRRIAGALTEIRT
jgi:hypothetical protein